ncbi:MAG: hypothetical protein KKA55_01910 [Proteobacteria bacterium]|nr:hypothetical protein [Pseudomonadota bacterium]MBU1594274.1 hypothetical protein [Pseudomonadota bacterium]
MHRIDGPGATEDDLFTAGDPGSGTEATELTADWLNACQEEPLYVIEQAGLTPDKGDNTQLHQAILALIAYATRLAEGGGIINTEDGLAVDPSVIDATAQLRYHGLI